MQPRRPTPYIPPRDHRVTIARRIAVSVVVLAVCAVIWATVEIAADWVRAS